MTRPLKFLKINRLVRAAFLVLFFPASPVFPAADHFYFTLAPSGSSYTVNEQVDFTVEARNPGESIDSTFNQLVTVGLYESDTLGDINPLLTDPQAIIMSGGFPVGTGTAVLSFVNGVLSFQVVFQTGADQESLLLRHSSITTGNNLGPYAVKGYTVRYYAKDADGNPPFAAYPPNTDLLDLDPSSAVSTVTMAQDIPFSSDGSNAVVFVATGITGRYAAGGTDLFTNLLVRKKSGAGSTGVMYRIILDYNGTLPATGGLNNYISPRSTDTVYQLTSPYLASSVFAVAPQASFVPGSTPIGPSVAMSNGQAVLMVWNTSSTAIAELLLKTPNSPVSQYASNISVPFSDLNISPVRGLLTPKLVLATAPVTMYYNINNLSGQSVSLTAFKIPANPGGSGVSWALAATPTTRGGVGILVTYLNPNGITDGAVTIDWGSAPVTAGENVSVTLVMGTASSVVQTNWDFELLTVKDTSGSDLISDSLGAQNIETLDKPSVPSFITATATNYTGSGNQVNLSWGQVTDNMANGYILSRRSPAGSGAFSAFLTIGPSSSAVSITTTVDMSAANLNAYDYTVAATNPVAQSNPVTTTSPVTPFANPGQPTGVSALTGGTTVRLSWTSPVSVAGSFSPGGYYLYRGTTSNGEAYLTQLGLVTTWDDTTVSAGTTYFYKIASVDNQSVTGTPGTGAHISGYAGEVSGFPPGNPPRNAATSFLAGTDTVRLNWDAPVSNLNSLVNYVIARNLNGTSPSTILVASSPTTYDHSGLLPGEYCIYRIAAVDSLGVTTNYSSAVTGRVGPSAPVSFAASASASAITLAWNANPTAENVLSYVVYRNSGQIANPGSSTTAVTNTTGLVQGTDYLYEIEAVDNAGVTGPRSSLTSALLPNTPASFSVTANAAVRTDMDMFWTAPVNGGNVIGYNLYRDTDSIFPGAVPVTMGIPSGVAGTTITLDTGLSSGTTYFYFLQAQNIGGAGPTIMAGQQVPPTPPQNVIPIPLSGSVSLNWDAAPASQRMSNYTVYGRDLGPPVGSFSILATPTTNSFNHTSALTGHDYEYYITATNPGGGGAPGGGSLASGSVTAGRLPQVPGEFATGVFLSAPDSSTVTFTWAAVTIVDPNAMAAVVYENGAAAATLSASATLFVNAAASASTTYTYNLAVTNAYGAGATAVTPASRLTYPTTVTLNPITLLPNNVYMATSWTAIGTSDVTGYRVYRSMNGGAYSLAQTIAASTLTFPITFTYPVQHGQEYSFQIGAVNATGEGLRSNAQTVRTGPSIPAGLTAVSGVSTSSLGVSLSWHANPTAEGVDTYTIYRSQTVSDLGSYVTISTIASPTTIYSDSSSLTDQAIYYYLLSASGAGMESFLNTVNARAVTAFLAPNAPLPPTADPANASATLTWTAVAATSYPVTGYNLIRTGPSGVTQVNSALITGLSYIDTGLTNGVTYSYELQVRDDQGHLSALSSPASVEPLAPPGIPANVAAGAGDYAIQISWDPATPGTLPIGGYLLFRQALPSDPVSLILQAPATTVAYVDTNGGGGLAYGVTYAYWLQAFDSSGVTTGLHIGSSSVPVSLSATGHVNPPSNIIATASPGSVYLTWTDSFALGAPVTGYQLWRATSPGGAYVSIAGPVTAGGLNSYLDTGIGVINGTRYYYYFVAWDTVPQPSINSVTVTALPARPPEPPTGVTATDGVSQVTVSWNAAVTVDNAPVSAYLVYRAILPAAPAIAATVLSPAVTFTDTGLATPATCVYTIDVVNINGTAGTSLAGPVTGYPYAEFAPTGLSSIASNTAVTLSWTPYGSPSYTVTGFSISRTDLSGASATILSAASSPYTDTNVTAGQLFVYRVQALDIHGHSSVLSSPVTDGPANPPSEPSPFMAFAGASQNLLDWGASAPATPGGLPVSLYVVVGSNGVSTVLPATQTWYLDETAVDGSPVTYRVQAIDESGRTTAGVHISAAAGPVSATSSATNVNPPTGLAATATGPTSIVLTWRQPNDQGRVIAYYTVFRSSSLAALNSSPTSIARVDNPALSPATQFVDTGVSADADYFYMVRAYDQINTLESSNSNHAWARTPRPLRPVPPVTSGVMAFDRNLFRPLEGEDLAIYFILPTAGSVQIDIYNVAGRHVQYLYLGERPAGIRQDVLWDGKDHGGNVVSSGIYLIEIKAPGFHQVSKVAVIK